ncbi:MAG: RecX family transcriptional regulator [Gemmatimonadaceae bacterium]
MPTITAIQPSVRRSGRWVVDVDGRPVATLGVDGITRLRLAVGRDVGAILPAIEAEGAIVSVMDRALAMLAFRPRARVELQRLLVRKGEDSLVVDRALARLVDTGAIDDEVFARQFARSKLLGSGNSRRRLHQDLSRKGVARDVAERAINAVLEDEAVDEDEIVRAAAEKKARALARLDPMVRRRRLYAYLARRGYDGDAIRRAMTAVAAGGETDEGLDGIASDG